MSVFRPNLFKNNVAIVTGGGTGIGRAIAFELLHLGAKVMIASRKEDRLSAAAEEMSEKLKKLGNQEPKLSYRKCNIRQETESQFKAVHCNRELIDHTIDKFGKIDFVVNNGGGQFISSIAEIRHKGWNAVIDTNLTGTFLMMRESYNKWFKEHGGVIVNIIADMWKGYPLVAHTGAARAGVYNLTQSAATEWAADGVRVNCVAPGIVESATAKANYTVGFDVFEEARKMQPSQRSGTPDEIAAAVCFLLSPGASFISGACLKVDCGASLSSPTFWKIQEHENSHAYKWIPDPPSEEQK